MKNMLRIPDTITGAIGTTGTTALAYIGEPFLAAAIAVCTLIAILPKAAASACKICKWIGSKIEK